MKILVGISTYSPDLKSPSGGSERQALATVRELADRGHDVRYKNILWKGVDWGRGYDIVHLFNANGPNGPYQFMLQEAQEKDIPVVLSPIYWPVEEMKSEMLNEIDNNMVLDLYFSSYKPIVQESDVLLPNAELEMRKVEEFADLEDPNYQVIPNAIDKDEIEAAKGGQAPDEWGDYVLCVGRIEPRKNQHRLVQAMELLWAEGYDLSVVMIGSPHSDYLKKYEDIFEGHKGKLFISKESLSPKAAMSAMKDAEVLAMPSWLETPGLVALEAAAVGTKVVATNRGTTGEYFGDLINYCDPDQPFSIAEGIKKSLDRDPPDKLKELIFERYNYERVGELNEKIYKEVLNGKGN